MEWILIFQTLVETFLPLIQDCLEPSPEGVKRLRDFGPRITLAVYRAARKVAVDGGIDRSQASKAARFAVEAARYDVEHASDDELLAAINELRAGLESVS